MTQIERFEAYIVGDFSNAEQVEKEREAGKQIHPYAKHINRKIDHLIRNRPHEDAGFFVLEESIYIKDGVTTLKPHLFRFSEDENHQVVLMSLQLPQRYCLEELINDNPNLYFDYEELKPSLFQPLVYAYEEGTGFFGESISDFVKGRSFRLSETIARDRLEVMEEMSIDGTVVTEHKTPIIYRRECQ